MSVNQSLEEGELAPYEWKRMILLGRGTLDLFLCSSCLYTAQTEEEISSHVALHQGNGG